MCAGRGEIEAIPPTVKTVTVSTAFILRNLHYSGASYSGNPSFQSSISVGVLQTALVKAQILFFEILSFFESI
jgi:hypothetical protein